MDDQLNLNFFSIINTEMAVRSMRDSGYKSTTHALAELVDNSIEARATTIEIIGVSRVDPSTQRKALVELAVLDNGTGMDKDTLRRSLRYGDGTRESRDGIGRFGLGLPNSSMSQATRVDVWSWQSGPTNALHTHLSIDDVKNHVLEIPEPQVQPLPRVYLEGSTQVFDDSGTLVVWSDLDRVEWRRAATTFKHTEALLGRIYRRFLAPKPERLHADDPRSGELGPQRTIFCVPVDDNGDSIAIKSNDIVNVRPNDPLYLMTNTSCPSYFGDRTMFQELETGPIVVPLKGGVNVRVRASYVRPEARDRDHDRACWPDTYRGYEPGNTPWGKHAGYNTGVSVMRAHRELEIDTSWAIGYDPRERWWKVEVDFPTSADELVGVTNNKQGTMVFRRLADFDWKREALPGETSRGDVRRRLEKDGDPRAGLLDLKFQIDKVISGLRKRIREQTRGRSKKRRVSEQLVQEDRADAKVTAAIKRRRQDGYKGESDSRDDEIPSDQEKRDVQKKTLVDKYKIPEEDALRLIEETMRSGYKVRWIEADQQTPAFFNVESEPGVVEVVLNSQHPVHDYLCQIMQLEAGDVDEQVLRDRLAKISAAFRILIYAWARFEDEQDEPKIKRQVRNTRMEWGKYAEEFFDDDDDERPPTDTV